ncbi:MAG: chemotaxis protein CheX [Thermodesulfobacteriota bacterium]
MDVRYINPFLTGAVEVLGTMASVALKPQKPYLKQHEASTGDISGIIGVTGSGAMGSISVTFTFDLIQVVMKNMLGDDVSGLDDEVKDAVGELTNQISGAARRHLAQEGLSLQAGIPTVVAGKNHTIKHIVTGPVLVIPFEGPQGKMIVEVSLVMIKTK